MRKTSACFSIAAICLFLPFPAYADSASKQILDNGLTVLVQEMPASPVVCVYGLVQTGSATEGEYLGSGISHFLEHMLFKGTPEKGVGEIASHIQALGGTINASTGQDYTIYTLEVPPEALDTALGTLADMLMNSSLEQEEMEKERQVIIGEMRLNEDDPDRRLGEIAFENIYLQHPYHYPVIGYKKLLLDVTRDDLGNYYRSRYVSNNIILSIAGNVRAQDLFAKVQKVFGGFARQRGVLRNLPSEPPQISPRRYEQEYPTELTRLVMAFSGVSLLDRDLYALDILAMILGQGDSSPLYLNVAKRKDLVHAISAANFTPVDRGFFEITAVLSQNGEDAVLGQENVEPTIAAVWEEIGTVQRKGVAKKDLEKAKRQVLSGHLFSLQKASGVAYAHAVDEAWTGDYQFSQKYVEAVKKVTAQDIQRVAVQYLIEPALTVVLLKPQQEKSPRENRPEAHPGEIRKSVLDNGLTVLLREDHTLPVASIRVSLQGGTRQEAPELNGLSMLTADVLAKGTKAFSAQQIAAKSESLGMDLDTFSGKNSFGLSVECLSEDLGQALDMIESMIKNPTFPPEEILKTKEDMKAAVRQREDDIFQTTALALKQAIFQTHPLRLDEGGTIETIDRIDRKDVLDFYHRLAVAPNMVISVFGDIAPEKIKDVLKNKFGPLPRSDPRLKSSSEDSPGEPRAKELFMDKEQAMVMYGFHGVDLKNPDRYGLDILAAILGSSFSGRLFNSVREKLGQAYTLGGDSATALDAGWVYFYVLTTQEKIAQVQQTLRQEIQNLQSELVSDAELKNTKTYLKGLFRAGLETNASLSFVSGLDELYGLGYRHYEDYEAAIDRVSAQDIRQLAQRYCDLNKVVIVTTQPKKNAK